MLDESQGRADKGVSVGAAQTLDSWSPPQELRKLFKRLDAGGFHYLAQYNQEGPGSAEQENVPYVPSGNDMAASK